jgi:hypothetical protein
MRTVGAARKETEMGAIELVENSQLTERPRMKSGDTVRVHVKVREGDKERIQIFEGIVIGMHRGGVRASFTVLRADGASADPSRPGAKCPGPDFLRRTSVARILRLPARRAPARAPVSKTPSP